MKTELKPFFKYLRSCISGMNDQTFGVISEKPFREYCKEVNDEYPLYNLYKFESDEHRSIVRTGNSNKYFYWIKPDADALHSVQGFFWSGFFVMGQIDEETIATLLGRTLSPYKRIDFEGGFMLLPNNHQNVTLVEVECRAEECGSTFYLIPEPTVPLCCPWCGRSNFKSDGVLYDAIRIPATNDDVWKLMFGDEVIHTSDLQYEIGATLWCRYLNGSRQFRVISVDETAKVCKLVEVKK